MAEFDVDLFVIGAGSGGVRAARISAGYGVCKRQRNHKNDPVTKAKVNHGERIETVERVV